MAVFDATLQILGHAGKHACVMSNVNNYDHISLHQQNGTFWLVNGEQDVVCRAEYVRKGSGDTECTFLL